MVPRRKMPKEYRPLIKAVVEQGGEAIERKNGVLLRLPNGQTMMLHTTPGQAALRLKRGELRRAGIDV